MKMIPGGNLNPQNEIKSTGNGKDKRLYKCIAAVTNYYKCTDLK